MIWLLPAACVVLLLSGFGGNSKPGGAHFATNGLGTIKLTPAQYRGELLFKTTCGGCHTLKAAHTEGTVGPDLDILRPPAAAVIATINSGPGKMPAHLLKGTHEKNVASFVAAVTAH